MLVDVGSPWRPWAANSGAWLTTYKHTNTILRNSPFLIQNKMLAVLSVRAGPACYQ
jgi:hypothetical protein